MEADKVSIMKPQVELVPLICLNCKTPVPAEADEFVWSCTQCGQGLLLDVAEGLKYLDIHYADDIPPTKAGRPFWVVSAQVALVREAEGSWHDRSDDHAERFWEGEKMFFIPAFTTSIDDLLEVSKRMLARPPDLNEGPRVSFEPVRLSPADLPALIELIVLGIEAGRKDKVTSIDISVELGEPRLWILP